MLDIGRREFITLLGGVAAACPIVARAQQGERIRRIGVLLSVSASDAEFQRRVAVLRQALGELGWTEKNTTFEFRFAEGKLDRLPALAAELVQANVEQGCSAHWPDYGGPSPQMPAFLRRAEAAASA
jgi:hypothetical protein